MDDHPQMQPVDPAMVKYLRVLVTALSATMIIGFIIITALFVTRFTRAADVTLPVSITLPDGTAPAAFTQGGDWYAVVTSGDDILIFDRMTGQLRQTIRIEN
jgi:hypothetical protein